MGSEHRVMCIDNGVCVFYMCTACGATCQGKSKDLSRFRRRHPFCCEARKKFNRTLAQGTRSVDLGDKGGWSLESSIASHNRQIDDMSSGWVPVHTPPPVRCLNCGCLKSDHTGVDRMCPTRRGTYFHPLPEPSDAMLRAL